MRLLRFILIVFFALFEFKCHAQSGYQVPEKFYRRIDELYSKNLKNELVGGNVRTLSAHSILAPLMISRGKVSSDSIQSGIYLVSPPIDPKIEFVCLIGHRTIKCLDSKNTLEDFPVILQFIEHNGLKASDSEWISLFEKLVLVYRRHVPKANAYLPK